MKEFFDEVKPLFGGKFSQSQVSGMELLLENLKELGVKEQAYLLATVFHETAFTMQPITEYGGKTYFNKYEPTTRIGKTLGNTVAGDGYKYRGRGYVQITGRANYDKASKKLGVDFVKNPELALVPEHAAKILVLGCTEGWFTGKKLSDYLPDYKLARRVVNGNDKADSIASYANTFEKALLLIPKKEVKEEKQIGFWQALMAFLKGFRNG